MVDNVSALRRNLLELYACKNSDEVVPSRSGRSIYTSKSLRGKIVKFFLPKKRLEELRAQALDYLRCSVLNMMEELGDREREYLENSWLKANGEKYSVRELKLAEERALRYYSKMSGFWRDIQKGKNNFAVETITGWCSEQELKGKAHFIRFVQRNKNIEIVTGRQLPLGILSNISQGKKLKSRDEKRMKEWIEAIKVKRWKSIPSYRGPVTNLLHKTRKIHQLIHSLFDMYFAKTESADMVHLTAGLYHLGLRTLEKNDPIHNDWRNSLKTGDRLTLHSGEVILGEELSNDRERKAGYRRFLIENDEHHEAQFYPSVARLYLEVDLEREEHYGIPNAPIKEIEPEGRMLLRTRIKIGLNEIPFDPSQDYYDRRYFQPIKDLMKVFAGLSYTPSDFYPEGFGFATDGRIYARYLMIDRPFSFEALENFAWECSRGKYINYKKLMNALKSKERMEEYRNLFIAVWKAKDHSGLIDLNGAITNPEILRFRRECYEAAANVYQSLYEHLSGIPLKHKNWVALLQEAMGKCYKATHCVRLPPDFQKLVIDRLKKKHPKIFPKEIPR